MTTTERWILVSNCQTHGLAHSLQMLAEDVEVEPVDVAEFQRDLAGRNARFGDYDRVLVGRSALDTPGADFSGARRLDELPEMSFTAFHPDLTYVVHEGRLVAGPLDVYHSALAFLAHARGRSVAETLPLFERRTYAACGYLDRWPSERDALVLHFGQLGLDIDQAVRRWGRGRAFMHSTNHPHIRVLYDVARLYLEREGYAPRVSDVLPQDNLVGGGVFPVYPEIGETLGVAGAYLFKRAYRYEQLDLRRYVEECFAVYDAHPAGSLSTHAVFRASTDRVAAFLDGPEAAR